MTAVMDTAPRFVLELADADSSSPQRARRWTAWVLEAKRAPQDTIDTAVLAVSELVTNAALYAGGRVLIAVEALPTGVRLSVHDTGPGPIGAPHAGQFDEHGRGLVIVQALADKFDITTTASGTTVTVLIGYAAPDTNTED